MVAIHPSLTLVLDLDERLATQETKLEIKRCYAHVGMPIVRTHRATGEEPGGNVARFLVSMGTKHYLASEEAGADELWEASVEPWLASMFYKVCNNMAAYNRRMRKIGLPELDFARVDVELENGQFTVGLVPDPQNRIPREAAAHIGRARMLLNDGTLEGAVRVDMPSAVSWEEQLSAAQRAWDEAHPKPADDAGVAASESVPAENETNEGAPAESAKPLAAAAMSGPMKHYVGPMPDKRKDPKAYAAWEEADREAKSYENTAVPPTDSDELPPIGNMVEAPEPELFDFDVDYTQWDVAFADGTKRTFDSSAAAFAF